MHSAFPAAVLAAQTAAWDRIKHVPFQTWLNLGICVLAVVLVLRMWRTLRKFNDFAPWIVSAIAAFMILCYWTYNRNEPTFLTPMVERLTLLLPTKSKHEQELDRLRKSREEN